ncbi:hypothetical protein Taro_029581 [Colocasia esculenta]|uniref:Uncharacterized protein n=1 Tax=Colocasia esculenta TaxID=4460 RepID=A0A843VPF9_COLES|nr:hypothetical protein [Colocasia esculenta]
MRGTTGGVYGVHEGKVPRGAQRRDQLPVDGKYLWTRSVRLHHWGCLPLPQDRGVCMGPSSSCAKRNGLSVRLRIHQDNHYF